MTATLPPVDSSDHDLADEISDVIDEHGPGLEADELPKVVERVAGRLEGQFDEEVSTRELAGELHRFVADQAEAADRELRVDTLRAIADSLLQGSLAPEAGYRQPPPMNASPSSSTRPSPSVRRSRTSSTSADTSSRPTPSRPPARRSRSSSRPATSTGASNSPAA